MRNSVWDFYRDKLIIFYCSRQLGSKENIFSGPVWKLNISVATWSTALGQGKHSDALGTLSPVKFFVPCSHRLHIDILVPT
jgi:hypothetical protein